MSSFHVEARNVADVPIVNAIDSGNLKQALKLVEKRLSKKSDDYLFGLRYYIRSAHPNASERGLAACDTSTSDELFSVSDMDTLDLYEAGLHNLYPRNNERAKSIIGRMSVSSVKKNPKNEDLAKNCFQRCIKNQDYENAQTIAAILENNKKENRLYPFWSVTSLAFYVISGQCPVDKLPLMKMLATRKIKVLADATSKATNSKQLPARSIQQTQELFLLYHILDKFGTTEEQIGYIKDPALGPESSAAKGELKFVTKKLELLTASNFHEEVFETALHYLQKARPAQEYTSSECEERYSDWQIWSHFLGAAKALENDNINKRLSAEIDEQIKAASARSDKIALRNSELAQYEARMKGLYANVPSITISIPQIPEATEKTYIAAIIIDYIHVHGGRTATFGDVKEAFGTLPRELQDFVVREILESASRAHNNEGVVEVKELSDEPAGAFPRSAKISSAEDIITMTATGCKLSYYAAMAYPHASGIAKKSDAPARCAFCQDLCDVFCKTCSLHQFSVHFKHYQEALRMKLRFPLLVTDKHPADDLAVVAVMSLLIAAGLRPWTPGHYPDLENINMDMVKQAALILEFALSNSTANSDIMLMLVRLYAILGAGSLAIRAYERLKIKQIQVDSMAYVFIDRLSSLHPHPFKVTDDSVGMDDTNTIDPLKLLKRYQDTRKTYGPQINKNIVLGLSMANYYATFDQREVVERLHMSVAAVTAALESRRITRIMNPGTEITNSSHGYDLLDQNPENSDHFNDNSDITAFASYEVSGAPPFEQYTRMAPSATSVRMKAFLLVDRLYTILSNPADSPTRWVEMRTDVANCRAARAWQTALLADYHDSGFTIHEVTLAKLATNLLALLDICWHNHGNEEQHHEAVDLEFQRVGQHFSTMINLVENIRPDQPYHMITLHPLYIGHELAMMYLDFEELIKKNLSGIKFESEPHKRSTKNIHDQAEELRSKVKTKADEVRSVAEAGGRLDGVIDGLIREDDESSITKDGKKIGEMIEELVGENYVEQWAGELLGSWEESAAGLVRLK